MGNDGNCQKVQVVQSALGSLKELELYTHAVKLKIFRTCAYGLRRQACL